MIKVSLRQVRRIDSPIPRNGYKLKKKYKRLRPFHSSVGLAWLGNVSRQRVRHESVEACFLHQPRVYRFILDRVDCIMLRNISDVSCATGIAEPESTGFYTPLLVETFNFYGCVSSPLAKGKV